MLPGVGSADRGTGCDPSLWYFIDDLPADEFGFLRDQPEFPMSSYSARVNRWRIGHAGEGVVDFNGGASAVIPTPPYDSGQNRIDRDRHRSQSRDGDRHDLPPAEVDSGIAPLLGGGGSRVDLDAIVRQVHNPIFGDVILGVQLEFGCAVASERGIGDFDDEESIAWNRVATTSLFDGRTNDNVRQRYARSERE